jgi:vacuolar protein sorting-associated protein VTA1
MAASIPPSLKAADITRFAQRAAQLETAKPVIAYYCISSVLFCRSLGDVLGKYQVVNQILAKGLHNADQESIAYTTRLMDDLEQVRCSAFTKAAAMS